MVKKVKAGHSPWTKLENAQWIGVFLCAVQAILQRHRETVLVGQENSETNKKQVLQVFWTEFE